MIRHAHRFPQFWSSWQAPRQPVEIDWQHPLAKGLVACYLPGFSLRDLCGTFPTLGYVNGGFPTVNSAGPALNCNATMRGAIATLGATLATQYIKAAATAFWAGDVAATPGACILFGIGYASSGVAPYGVFYLATAASGNLQVVVSRTDTPTTGISLSSATTPFASVSVRRTAAGTWRSGGNLSLYADGVSAATPVSGAASTPVAGASSYMSIGDFQAGAAGTGSLGSVCYLFGQELSAGEILALHRQPFALLRPTARRAARSVAPAPVLTARQPSLSIIT